MGVLQNWRRELYARALAEVYLAGLSPREVTKARLKAYTDAGFAANKDNARRDASRPEIKARITELFTEALEYRDVRLPKVLTRIDRVGKANVTDFYEREIADGKPTGRLKLKDLTALPRELTEALRSITAKEDGTVAVECWDKNQANFALLKHLGGVPDDRAPAGNTFNFFAGLSVDDQRTLADALEALPGRPRTVDLEVAREHSEG